MKSDLKTRHGGKILADALAAQGVKLAFGVPGESYLPVLDGMHDLRETACASSSAARKAAPPTWRRPTASSPASPACCS